MFEVSTPVVTKEIPYLDKPIRQMEVARKNDFL
jgi:hypothetical protein